MRSRLPTMRVLLLGLMLSVIPVGCATMTGSAVTDDAHATFCQIASPIYWSKDDTAATVQQVKELNAVGMRLCGWGK